MSGDDLGTPCKIGDRWYYEAEAARHRVRYVARKAFVDGAIRYCYQPHRGETRERAMAEAKGRYQ